MSKSKNTVSAIIKFDKNQKVIANGSIAGIGFVIASLVKFHQYKQNPTIKVIPISNKKARQLIR
jgi:hypothetical protein